MSSPSKQSYNLRNPAVKRILQEVKELDKEKGHDFIAQALEDNLFEWHFVMRGPSETAFEGGIYHGRILLPADYPMKPPSFMMLTPNGRFQTSTKICLSISSHHPEHWQPSWSVRTAITAMIAFMPTPGNGAIGSLDLPDPDRKQLAGESLSFIPTFGSTDRQAISAEMHSRMLVLDAEARAEEQRQREEQEGAEAEVGEAEVEEGQGEELTREEKVEEENRATEEGKLEGDAEATKELQPGAPAAAAAAAVTPAAAAVPEEQPHHEPPQQRPSPPSAAPSPSRPSAAPATAAAAAAAAAASPLPAAMAAEEKGLTWLAGALSVAIAALLLRKIFVMFDVSLEELLQM